MVRNSLTVVGIAAILGVFFFFIRPDWVKQISSSQPPEGPAVMTKVTARLSGDRLLQPDLPRDKGGLLHVDTMPGAPDFSMKLVEEVGDDLPSRNSPFLLVINKANNTMRYCRLGSGVRKATLRTTYPDVKVQEVPNTPGGPYQLIIWVPNDMDLLLEFDLLAPAPPRI